MTLREVNRVGEGQKNVPKLRFKGYEDAWEQRKFSDIALRESTVQESSRDFPSVEYDDVIAEAGRLNKDVNQKEVAKKGIVFDGSQVLYGKLRPYLHNWLSPDFSGVAVGDWWVLKPIKVDKSFLYRLIQTQQFDDIANQSTGSKMPRADWNLVSNLEFAVPVSGDEQYKIGGYFSSLDTLIALHQRKYDALKTMKKTLLSKMFPKDGEDVPEIRFKGFTDAWEQRKLGDIADKVTVKNSNLQYIETFTNSAEVGIISQRDYFDHDIANLSNLDGYYIVQKEDFVYNPRISTSAPVGPINRNKLGRVGVMSPLYTVFRTHNVDTTYLEYFFKSQYWHSFMKFHGDSGARSDRFSIKDAIFFKMPIPLPDIDEQQKIGDYLNSVDHLITLHQRKLDELKNIKKTLLQQMFV